MIIEVEAFSGDCYLHGKTITLNALTLQVESVLADVNENGFVSLFCSRFGYERIHTDVTSKIDFRIDLDTHKIYKPHY